MTVFAILCDNVLPKDTNPCKNLKEHTESECTFRGCGVKGGYKNSGFYPIFFILPLHVSLEQIYLDIQLTFKEILPLEEVCLYFVYPLHESSIVVLFTKGRALFEQG